MLCKKPYRNGVMEYGCGQCMPCRVNKVRLWTGRMLLESYQHPASCFVTLTYAEEHVPVSVEKRHWQLFMKRLRKAVHPRLLRFYAVGEYGEKSMRPHYHAIVFGLFPTEEEVVKKCWPYGFVKCGTAEKSSMSYVACYVVKRMTKPGDRRLGGRCPEWSLMSRQPGIGAGALGKMVESYGTEAGMAKLTSEGYPVGQFRVGGRKYALGRYLHMKLAEKLGLDKEARMVYNLNRMLKVYEEQVGTRSRDYEAARASRVAAEEGRYQARVRPKTL